MSIFAKYCYYFIFLKKNQEMNISVTDKQKSYIDALVASGDYQNSSEAVRDAIRLHQQYRSKLTSDLQREIEKGWDGPVSSRSVKDIIAAKRETLDVKV